MAERLEETVSVYLDTHVAVWLHAGDVDRLSSEAKRQIEANDLLISPMVLLELQYLFERKRVRVEPGPLQGYLNSTFGIAVCDFPFPAVSLAAIRIDWTSDPFDRLIVAQAIANHDAALLTSDTKIRRHYPQAVW